MNPEIKPLRAERSDPVERRKQIIKSAIYLSEKIGHLSVTNQGVAKACRVSTSLVRKYFSTVKKLQDTIYKEAIRAENVKILRHCLTQKKCKMSPELKRKTIAFLTAN
jgi:AcrR family transcriptional regulator